MCTACSGPNEHVIGNTVYAAVFANVCIYYDSAQLCSSTNTLASIFI